MRKGKTVGRRPLLTLLVIAMLFTTALAEESPQEMVSDLATNTAAWLMAVDAGDEETAAALQAQNEALAEQLAGEGGSATLNADGTWNILTAGGVGIKTSLSENGKNTTVTASVGTAAGFLMATSAGTYMDESIDAFMENGGTHELLQQGYNNAAAAITAADAYGDMNAKTSSAQEIAMVKELLGLTDEEAEALGAELDKDKMIYEKAHDEYKAALASGDEEAAAKAKETMDKAHADAEAARAQYNYTADNKPTDALDGGYYYGGTEEPEPVVPNGAFFHIPDLEYRMIVVHCSEGGTVNPAPEGGVITVALRGSVNLTMLPSAGYKVRSVTVDGTDRGELSSYMFRNVTENHTLDVEFEPCAFTITASAGAGGSVSPSGTVSVEDGKDQTFSITPDTGYRIKAVKVDGTDQGEVSGYTFRNVRDNHTISAEFEKLSYTIRATAGEGGSVSPGGSRIVKYGDSQSFAFNPDTGYRIRRVVVDGTDVGAVSSYTFTNVTEAHMIHVDFERISLTITARAGLGGSISPGGAVTVEHGGSQTFSITPDTGYKVKRITVDGADLGDASSYTFRNVREDHAISVEFEKLSYTISASAGRGGSISPSGSVSVEYGSSKSYGIVPSWGYEIEDVLVDGRSVGAISSFTFRNVTSEHSIAATFRPNGRVSLEDIGLTDSKGVSLAGKSIKSGYGIFADVTVDTYNVLNVSLTLSYDFGEGEKTVDLVLSEGKYVFPVNSASPTRARCIYIPVGAADGNYTVILTLTGIDVEGNTVTDTDTAVIQIRGSMYEDDFTGDR